MTNNNTFILMISELKDDKETNSDQTEMFCKHTPVCSEGVQILYSGFPSDYKLSKIRKFMASMFPLRRFNIATDYKNRFHGFVFVKFRCRLEAESYIEKKLFFGDYPIELKIADENVAHLEEAMDNMRRPKQLFVNYLPPKLSKAEVIRGFSEYGEVYDLEFLERSQKFTKSAYVTFTNHESAKKCAE